MGGPQKSGPFGLQFAAVLGLTIMALLMAVAGFRDVIEVCACFGVFIAPALAITLTTTYFGADSRIRRRGMLIRKRLCIECGYDLRASDEICPECGKPVPAPKSAIEALERMTSTRVDVIPQPKAEIAGTPATMETAPSTGTPPPPG